MFGYNMGFGFGPFILLIIAWTLYWKGMALWKAARADDRNWFIALLVINTVGILEIIYIYYISKNYKSEPEIEVKKEENK